jgi:hypothetical protein
VYKLTLTNDSLMKQNEGWMKTKTTSLHILISQHLEKLVLDIIDIKYDIILGIL